MKLGAILLAAPHTYQEWLDCFEHLKCSRVSSDYIDILSQGSMQNSQQMAEKFNVHLINLLNDMLDSRTKRFIKELNQLLEFSDIANIADLFKNFSKEIKQCLFFYKIEFIAIDFRGELLHSVEKQTNELLQKVIKHLSKQALETNNLEMEDALYQIKKIKFFGC